jgi:hypothetical protein
MKKFFLATAATFALFAGAAFAGNVNGCETLPVDGSNYTIRADVTCALSNDKPDGDNSLARLGLVALVDLLPEDTDK